MKILLIQPPWYGFQNIVSSKSYLGLAYIAAVLEKEGHQVCIFNGETFFKDIKNEDEHISINEEAYLKNFAADNPVYKDIIEAVKDFDPEIVGISFMTPNSTSAYILAKLLKDFNPNLPIIAGGVHPTLVPSEPLENRFDFVVKGEGEVTIVELIRAIATHKNYDNISGLYYIKHNQIRFTGERQFIKNLDDLPYPAFHLLHDFESQKKFCKGVITSRGCPFQCNYCASKLIWTRAVRFRSPENVAAEIRERCEKYGVTSFAFHDDTMTLNKQFVKKLCQLMLDFNLKIRWHCDTRGDTLDLETLKLMRRAGCYHIYLGLESGSPKIQESIKKRIDTKKIRRAIKMARQSGIETTVYFMVGFPDETEEDIMLSIETMRDLNPDHTIWSVLTPFPGTEIWNLAASRGLVSINSNWNNFFHHFGKVNIFKTLPGAKWNRMITLIDREQRAQERRFSVIKFKRKITNYLNLLRLSMKHPEKVLEFMRKRIKIHA